MIYRSWASHIRFFCVGSLLIMLSPLMAQQVIDRSAKELPTWSIEPPQGQHFTYYSGTGSSPNSLSGAKEQAIASVLSELIMAGQITAESEITTYQQQSTQAIISEVTREIKQSGASTTIVGLAKEEEYWQTVRTSNGIQHQYWILMKIPKPEYAGFDIPVIQGYGFPPVWRSALIPGWGQMYKGEKKKGVRLLRSEGILISIALISNHYSQSYSRKAAEERDADNRQFYNQWSERSYSISMLSGIMAGAIYGYNVFDAITSRGAKKYAFAPRINPTGEFRVFLSINF